MSDPVHVPAILQGRRRVRYLKIIAVFKILKGALLLCFGVSVLFLKSRPAWTYEISDWIDDEALVVHGKAAHYVLTRLQDVLAGGTLHAAGLLALFYCAVLLTEGIGVYMQKRWAELLMIFATAALIPLEVRHLFHRVMSHGPSLVALLILLANCFIVWFLYRVLKRDKAGTPAEANKELVKTR